IGVARDASWGRLCAAGCGGDDADIARGVFHRQALCGGIDPALRCRIGYAMDASRRVRRDVDDRAPSPHDEVRKRRMTAPCRRHQRAADLRLDLLWLEAVVGSHADRAAHVVVENVDAAEAPDPFAPRLFGTPLGFFVAYQ